MAGEGRQVGGWLRVRALVERAVELSADERASFLEREAGGDTELLAEARALLELDSTPHAFDTVDAVTPELLAGGSTAASELVPRRAGPWELRRVIGSGGMGVVHLAVRADGSFQQSVALKLLHVGADGDLVRERFRRERQVLANLKHPGIARLIDGGVTEEGVPWLAMEHVEGLPIDRHCDQERAPLHERVRLFQRVCDAVHEAHKNLVVHRDLKPSNILVTPQGEPKLLDFGIAKVLDPEKGAAGADLTGSFLGLMTPAYASPEQLAGLPITTASDIYSLGVLLYKLLTGHMPFGAGARSLAELRRVADETEPDRPSTAVTRTAATPTPAETEAAPFDATQIANLRQTTPRGLRRALSGDLDRIVLKALRKEPGRRYASAEQLGADLERYLTGRPVLARPDSVLYRTSRFLGRNRAATAGAAAALLALAAGLLFSLAQLRRADLLAQDERRARELGEERLAEVARLAGEVGEQKEAAEQQVVQMRELNEKLASQEAVARAQVKEVTKLASTLIFDMTREFAWLPGSTAASEHFLRTGLEHLERIQADAPDDPILLRDRAAGYMRLSAIQGGSEGPNLGHVAESHASCERAVELASAAFELASEDQSVIYNLASALTLLGSSLERLGRPAEALDMYTEALAVCQLVETDQRSAGLRYTEHSIHLNLAQLLVRLDGFEDAAGYLEQAERLLPRMDFSSTSLPFERGRQCATRGLLEEGRGDLDAAIAAANEAVEQFALAIADDPLNTFYARGNTMGRAQLASLHILNGEARRALSILAELERELAARCAADTGDRQARGDLTQVLMLTADAHALEGDREAAREAGLRRVTLAKDRLTREPANSLWLTEAGRALAALAEVERGLGLMAEATEHARAGLRHARDLVGREPENAEALRTSFVANAALARIEVARAELQEDPEARRVLRESAARWFRLALEDEAELERLEAASPLDSGRSGDVERELEACEQALAETGN